MLVAYDIAGRLFISSVVYQKLQSVLLFPFPIPSTLPELVYCQNSYFPEYPPLTVVVVLYRASHIL